VIAIAAFTARAAIEPATRPATTAAAVQPQVPQTVITDGTLQLTFGDERMVVPRGLQPMMLCTASGALIVQAGVPEKPKPTTRMTYPSAIRTMLSRDGGETWTAPGDAPLNMEGGGLQLRDGTVLALDTYITPGERDGYGFGQLYTSRDDWKTLQGPQDVHFDLPGTTFYGSSDDGGHPHNAQRLHRRMIELPSGDLLVTFYGWMQGDHTPSTYQPKMMKTRAMLARSRDRGQHWTLVSTIAADPNVGTEGFDEPVLCRVSKGPNAGRLICLMRTGRELYKAISDDEGATWTPAAPIVFAGIDIYRTELWVDMLRKFKDFHGKLLDENNPDELRGAVVDPDLIELRSGLLVAAFGVRIPQKLCWQHPEHPWNGNYLAFSSDHGKTWPTVVRVTSGILTTHYMAIEETPKDNVLFVAYDLGGWSKGMRRDVVGRMLRISLAK
jgi:hypothetical protein